LPHVGHTLSSSLRESASVKKIDQSFGVTEQLDVQRLNKVLREYSFTPQLEPVWDLRRKTFFAALPNSTEENAERNGVMYALMLFERREISRVKGCHCGKFFVPRRVDQRHCSVKCRVNDHQSSDEFKAKRRAADRERYRLHRDGRVKQTTRRKHGTQKAR
jgi:hypothetical protein